jgi:hypothetical protein
MIWNIRNYGVKFTQTKECLSFKVRLVQAEYLNNAQIPLETTFCELCVLHYRPLREMESE